MFFSQFKNSFRDTSIAALCAVVMALSLSTSAFAAGLVQINLATASEIAEALSGIGEKKAQAIVAYREKNGKFKSVDELTNVRGIGEKLVERNRKLIGVSGSTEIKAGNSLTPKVSDKADSADSAAKPAGAADKPAAAVPSS